MGSVGASRGSAGGNVITSRSQNRGYKDNTNFVDSSSVMSNALFSSSGALLSAINRAEDGSFDILNRTGDADSGTILYTDVRSSDGEAYEVRYQRSYENDENPREIRIIGFRRYDEGEW